MSKEINITIYPEYKEVFDDGNEKENLEFFLKDIPSFNIIQFISFVSACLDFKFVDFKTQNFILTGLIGLLNRKDQLTISYKINSINERAPKIVFHHIACLLILQTTILNFKPGRKKNLSAENSLDILKTFLLCNTKYSKEMKGFIPGLMDLKDLEKTLGFTITMDVAQNKLFNSEKDIFEQSYKLKEFNEFLKKDKEIGMTYYEEFLKYKNFSNLLEIIRHIWNIYFKLVSFSDEIDFNHVNTTIEVTNNNQKVIDYFDSISILEKDLNLYKKQYKEDDLDFKLIREKPLYKINENHFTVLSSNFLADKTFNSFFWDYYHFIQEKGYSKNLGDFKSYYSEVFVEKYLLQRIIDYMFGKTKFEIRQPGDILKKKDKHNKDYSDYYLRKGCKVLLFECKDKIMKADVKYSYDFKIVSKDITEKYVDSAVEQFLKIITSISNLEIPFEKIKEIDLNNLVIIPIIVYTDFAYNSRGVNFYINKIFKEKLLKLNLNIQIQDIIMIHIDTLINHQDIFHNKRIDFFNVLERYNRFIKKSNERLIKDKDSQLNTFKDFDSYLNNYILRERKILYSEKSYVKEIYQELYGDLK